ncbi:MAG: efflux RND transporter periplasmic adaptor subunit [Acidobacteriota bacterium]|nr:efflux RND transporter periplasmic adaptor subunit [Acidobacteriota bacterium]
MKPGRLLIAFLVAVALVTSGCSPSAEESKLELRVQVTVREVATGTVEDRVVATGTLRAPETVTLTVETAGTLRLARGPHGRRLAEGDAVEAGQVIAEVIGDDVRLAARTESTQQRYETARRDYESRKALYDEGLITELELRQYEDALADAKLEWERSLLTETRTRLTTPISGVIQKLGRDAEGAPVPDGQLVAVGYAVAQIAPIESLIAEVDLIGPDISRVRVGQTARIRHHAWDDRDFAATVIRLAPALDPITRTFRVEAEVGNAERLLRPGMFVEVTLIADRRKDVPVVPREAVTERGGVKVVFVLSGQQVLQREVILGLGDDEIVEVRSGLDAGERVVVKGLETLSNETKVRVSGA